MSIAVFVVFMRFLPNVLMGAFVARFVQQAMGLSPTVTGLIDDRAGADAGGCGAHRWKDAGSGWTTQASNIGNNPV